MAALHNGILLLTFLLQLNNTSENTMTRKPEEPTLYLLRYRFEYQKRPDRVGMWDRPATDVKQMAYSANRSDLMSVVIEGKNVVTREIKQLYNCDGQDYVNMQWLAQYRQSMSGSSQDVIGLCMITRYVKVEVFQSGAIRIRDIVPGSYDHYETWKH
jgi:hypothetical protein